MDIGRITLAFALAAVAGLVTGELRAQEIDLPPVPSSATDPAFSAENGPCFYNAYSWSVRGLLDQTLIGAEMRDLTDAAQMRKLTGRDTSRGSGCLGHYAVTLGDLYGPWAYYVMVGVPLPERASQRQVKAVWEASRELAAEAEAKEAREHAWVPEIGNGHGSDEALKARTIVLRVAPGPKPVSYNGVPIIESDKSWERFETADGSRVWREARQGNSYGTRGVRKQDTGRAYSGSNEADERVKRQ